MTVHRSARTPRAPDRGDRRGEATRRLSRAPAQDRHGSHQASADHGPVADANRPRAQDLTRNRLQGPGAYDGHRVTRSAWFVCAPATVVPISRGDTERRIVRVTSFKMSIYARSGRLGRLGPAPLPAQAFVHLWGESLHPPINRRVVDRHPAFGHHRFEIAVADRVPAIPPHRPQHDLTLEVTSLEIVHALTSAPQPPNTAHHPGRTLQQSRKFQPPVSQSR